MRVLRSELRAELPATLQAVDELCAEFRLWRAVACAKLAAFPSELLLREALTNSVVHGCGENPGERILCILRAKPGRLLISIRDKGEGFDWRSGWDRRADLTDTHGRGMEILRRYSNAVRFNPAGNSVTLMKRFEK